MAREVRVYSYTSTRLALSLSPTHFHPHNNRPRSEQDLILAEARPAPTMEPDFNDEAVKSRITQAVDFLDPSDQSLRNYRADVILMLNRGFRRLIVSIDDIRERSRDLAEGLLQAPFDFSTAFNRALKEVIVALPNRPSQEAADDVMYYVAYTGSFGEFSCNPRTLSSSFLNRMVSMEGIVTKCSLVRPKVVQSVHYSEKANQFVFRKYHDQTMSANSAATTSVYPQQDADGNPVRKAVQVREQMLMTTS